MINHSLDYIDQHIIPIRLGNINTQFLYLPARFHKNHDILLVFGHFGSINNYFNLANDLARYGNVTMPDLPGFNSGESLYKIHEKANLDELAEYLSTIVTYRFKKKKVTIVGVGFGVAIITRMLQRQPGLARKVNVIISLDGMAHYDDLSNLSDKRRRAYALIMNLSSWRLPSIVLRRNALSDPIIEKIYNLKARTDTQKAKKQYLINWRAHDPRTYFKTMSELLSLDNCNKLVKVKFVQVWTGTLNCLDNEVTDQHLQVIYEDFTLITSNQKFSKRLDQVKAMYSIKLPKELLKLLTKTAKNF